MYTKMIIYVYKSIFILTNSKVLLTSLFHGEKHKKGTKNEYKARWQVLKCQLERGVGMVWEFGSQGLFHGMP